MDYSKDHAFLTDKDVKKKLNFEFQFFSEISMIASFPIIDFSFNRNSVNPILIKLCPLTPFRERECTMKWFEQTSQF